MKTIFTFLLLISVLSLSGCSKKAEVNKGEVFPKDVFIKVSAETACYKQKNPTVSKEEQFKHVKEYAKSLGVDVADEAKFSMKYLNTTMNYTKAMLQNVTSPESIALAKDLEKEMEVRGCKKAS